MADSAWTVRTGKHGERDSWALENGVTGGGWAEIPDLTGIADRDELSQLVTTVYGTENPAAVPNYTGQLWALRHGINPGDLMVLPMKTTSQIALGVVTAGYAYRAEEPDPSRRHVIGVDWKRTDVARTAVKQDLLLILGSAMTVFRPANNDAVWRLGKIMDSGQDPGARTSSPLPPLGVNGPATEVDVTPTTAGDLEDYAFTRLQTLIQENFNGHELARLVEAVLVAEGFVCERKGPGADGGVDILAGRGPLGLDAPRLVVQVKSDSAPVGDPVVQTLQGAITRFSADQALLVAWGGVNRNAQRFLETMKFTIRVWNSNDLIEALLKTYLDLPGDIRSELPLKQIWVPVETTP
jgi:restriction system protein